MRLPDIVVQVPVNALLLFDPFLAAFIVFEWRLDFVANAGMSRPGSGAKPCFLSKPKPTRSAWSWTKTEHSLPELPHDTMKFNE